MIDEDNFGIFSILSGIKYGQFWYFSIHLGINCRQFWYFSTHWGVNCRRSDFGIFNTLGKNKHLLELELQTSRIRVCRSTNCTTNSLRMLYIKRDTTCNTGDVRQETWDRRHDTGDMIQKWWYKRHYRREIIQETGAILSAFNHKTFWHTTL